MLRFLFDTDHLTLYDHHHPAVVQKCAAQAVGAVGVSAVTVQEYLRGRLAALSRHTHGPLHLQAFARLVASVRLFEHFPIAEYDQAADTHFQQLKALRLRIGTQDLKIAAIVLANRLTLLTRNRRDFAGIPGLNLDDWSL